MYNGKYGKRAKSRNRSFVMLVSILALLIGAVGGTLAYLTTETQAVENTFTPANVNTVVNEKFDRETKTDVTVQNTGNTIAYIRAAIVVTWKDSQDGAILGQTPVLGKDFDMTIGEQWTKGSDCYYYYNGTVEAGAQTATLIKSCGLKPNATAPAGYGLNVEILSSGIQSCPQTAVQQSWHMTYDGTTWSAVSAS